MIVFDTEQLLCCDVDHTLLMWGTPYTKDRSNRVSFFDPYAGKSVFVAVNTANLKILNDRLIRGAKFIVWSQSGWQWAKACMESLGLDDNPNIIVTSKPIGYLDDKASTLWMGDQINLDMNDAYGVR